MAIFFNFGEKVPEYDFKVINENEARASAGIMFLFGIISLFSFILTKDLFYAEIFSITFIIEFLIRILISPIYAPYMLLGSIFVSNQKPNWVEAKPKKFAWVLGLMLGFVMGYFILFNIMTPARLLTCLICLVLLFTESAFGICLGCILYKKLNIKVQKCPGDVCEVGFIKPKRLNKFLSLVFISLLFTTTYVTMKDLRYSSSSTNDTQFQNSLKEDEEFLNGDDEEDDEVEEITTSNKECTPPQWAIDMGHRDMWIKHNCN